MVGTGFAIGGSTENGPGGYRETRAAAERRQAEQMEQANTWSSTPPVTDMVYERIGPGCATH